MLKLAAQQPDYLGIDSARDASGFGITVSYWRSEEGIIKWKQQIDHIGAQKMGQARWYEHYTVQISKVERVYSFHKDEKGHVS
jgi:heme-degrading monooxygenase HmoA